jgi:hypothetical protein
MATAHPVIIICFNPRIFSPHDVNLTRHLIVASRTTSSALPKLEVFGEGIA